MVGVSSPTCLERSGAGSEEWTMSLEEEEDEASAMSSGERSGRRVASTTSTTRSESSNSRGREARRGGVRVRDEDGGAGARRQARERYGLPVLRGWDGNN